MKKQVILISDMEGASGIFDDNWEACLHGSDLWREYGREYLTSDILAVCEAVNDSGVDEIMLYDSHFAGDAEYNVIIEKLPSNVRFFDVPDRCFYWRRIRGQAMWEPYGIITVGQHARYGEKNAYFPHSIQSPPIKAIWINDYNIAEIGSSVLNFCGTKYLANIGDEASHREAKELSKTVSCITVKDKERNWEPSPAETYPIIYQGVLDAFKNINKKEPIIIEGSCNCSLELVDGYHFEAPKDFPWKGSFSSTEAKWEAPNVEIALELFNDVRECICKDT
ncbi:MAG: M55 family metallopeptidase [Tissierellia bacterium]|nr:M55 family metallopeptidase [Tissierellia bacterium]